PRPVPRRGRRRCRSRRAQARRRLGAARHQNADGSAHGRPIQYARAVPASRGRGAGGEAEGEELGSCLEQCARTPDGSSARWPIFRDAETGVAEAGRTGLPAHLDPFIGRVAELEKVRAIARSERLVTLTGPGGAGKTRLAVEVAAVEDRPCFVDLSALTP